MLLAVDLDGDGWAVGAREAAVRGRPGGYVRYEAPISMEVELEGEWWSGFVLAESGARVTVRFTTGVGQTYMQVVDESRVRPVGTG